MLRIFIINLLWLVAYSAEACSACGVDYSDEEIKAYTFVTILLILLPISSFVFLGFWIGRKYMKFENENNENNQL